VSLVEATKLELQSPGDGDADDIITCLVDTQAGRETLSSCGVVDLTRTEATVRNRRCTVEVDAKRHDVPICLSRDASVLCRVGATQEAKHTHVAASASLRWLEATPKCRQAPKQPWNLQRRPRCGCMGAVQAVEPATDIWASRCAPSSHHCVLPSVRRVRWQTGAVWLDV
jgi:hypothetical protein